MNKKHEEIIHSSSHLMLSSQLVVIALTLKPSLSHCPDHCTPVHTPSCSVREGSPQRHAACLHLKPKAIGASAALSSPSCLALSLRSPLDHSTTLYLTLTCTIPLSGMPTMLCIPLLATLYTGLPIEQPCQMNNRVDSLHLRAE